MASRFSTPMMRSSRDLGKESTCLSHTSNSGSWAAVFLGVSAWKGNQAVSQTRSRPGSVRCLGAVGVSREDHRLGQTRVPSVEASRPLSHCALHRYIVDGLTSKN